MKTEIVKLDFDEVRKKSVFCRAGINLVRGRKNTETIWGFGSLRQTTLPEEHFFVSDPSLRIEKFVCVSVAWWVDFLCVSKLLHAKNINVPSNNGEVVAGDVYRLIDSVEESNANFDGFIKDSQLFKGASTLAGYPVFDFDSACIKGMIFGGMWSDIIVQLDENMEVCLDKESYYLDVLIRHEAAFGVLKNVNKLVGNTKKKELTVPEIITPVNGGFYEGKINW